MATCARALVRHMADCGYEVHVFANERAAPETSAVVHPVLTTDLARDLPRLARFDADLWHAINFGYAPLAFRRRPFVLTVHGTDFLTPWVRFTMDHLPLLWRTADWLNTRTARRALYQPALRCVDQVLTPSRFSARLFRREYPSVGPLQVVPNGVDEWFGQSTKDGARKPVRHPRRLLTVCNLDVANRRKNVDGLLRAVALLDGQFDLECWIAGDGAERPALERLARELGIAQRVRFLGRVDRESLREAYASSSLLVLAPRPRPGDVEGFGIVYLEAAAVGTPSLASRCGGAPDAVADGESGFFAADPSPAGIADALIRFFSGQVRFDEIAVRDHAARHAWPMVLRQVERVYERLLSCRPSGRATIRPQAVRQAKPAPALRVRSRSEESWATWVRRTPEVRARGGGGGRALLISYMFPPTGGSAVQRPAKLAKYLPEFGWSIEVLTAAHDRFPWSDESLLRDLRADCRVHRVPGYEPACLARSISSFLTGQEVGTDAHRHRHGGTGRQGGRPAPLRWLEDRLYWRMARRADRLDRANGESLWIRPAARAAIRRHRRCPFDVVISTGPPHFAHRVAMRLAGATGLPWVADLRDPLVSDFHRTQTGHRQADAMGRLERAIMRHASIVVTTCPSLADGLRASHPERSPESVRVVTNGFDRDDLREVAGTNSRGPCQDKECVFVAAGSFYGRREIARIVEPMQRVLDRHPEWQDRVRLVIAGTIDAEQRHRWERDRPDWVSMTGYLDHASALRLAARAACTVVVVPDCRHGRMSIPGKTFELLALPSHLLALAPLSSDTASLVADAGASTVVPLEDHARVASAIERIVRDDLSGRLSTQRDWPAIDVYDRRVIAAAFAGCLASACGREEGCENGFSHGQVQSHQRAGSYHHVAATETVEVA